MSISLDLSLKERLYLLVAKLPGKFSKFCPSYLREFKNILAKIKRRGGEVSYDSRDVLINYRGSKYKLRLGSTDFLVFDQVILEEEYAPIIELIKNYNIKANDFKIIDAGANVGFASLYFASKFNSSHIVAVEPDSSNFNSLQVNINLNQLTNRVHSLNGGIWGKTCKLNLSNSFRDGREWSLNLEEVSGNSSGLIDAFSLEDIMAKYQFNSLDFLKIDIEGGEKNLFEHWSENPSVLNRVRFLALEIHDEMVDRSFITNILKQVGFNLTEINETTFGVNVNFR